MFGEHNLTASISDVSNISYQRYQMTRLSTLLNRVLLLMAALHRAFAGQDDADRSEQDLDVIPQAAVL